MRALRQADKPENVPTCRQFVSMPWEWHTAWQWRHRLPEWRRGRGTVHPPLHHSTPPPSHPGSPKEVKCRTQICGQTLCSLSFTRAAVLECDAEQNEPKMKKHLERRCASSPGRRILHFCTAHCDFNIIHANRIAVMSHAVQSEIKLANNKRRKFYLVTFLFSYFFLICLLSVPSSSSSFTLKWPEWALYSQVDLVVFFSNAN